VFKYLGRPLSSVDDDWPAIYSNLSKARQCWGMVSRVLTCKGADPRTLAMFYKAIVELTLLYGSDTLNVSVKVFKALGGFHHWVARRLSGRMPCYLHSEDQWVYPPIEGALASTGLVAIEESVTARQNRLADHIATRPILELCQGEGRLSSSARWRYWWERVAV
jgi:hypothetical protein